jgi:hypothetical protein
MQILFTYGLSAMHAIAHKKATALSLEEKEMPSYSKEMRMNQESLPVHSISNKLV